jgi:hypothetical protein
MKLLTFDPRDTPINSSNSQVTNNRVDLQFEEIWLAIIRFFSIFIAARSRHGDILLQQPLSGLQFAECL